MRGNLRSYRRRLKKANIRKILALMKFLKVKAPKRE